MTKNLAKKSCAAAALLCLTGCLVKQPPGDDLGAPIDISVINNALIQAQAGVDPQKGFQVGDSGTVLSVYSSTTSSQITETDLYSITAAAPDSFTVQETANIAASTTAPASSTTTSTNFYRPGYGPNSSPTPTPVPSPTNALYKPAKKSGFFGEMFASVNLKLSRINLFGRTVNEWLSRISIEPSTAVGEARLPKALTPGSSRLLKFSGTRILPWTLQSEWAVRGKTSQVEGASNALFTARDLDTVGSASGSPSPSPTPSDEPTITSDLYYRLVTGPDSVLTKNCTQISNCTVHTTHIQFEELLSTSAGQTIRLHWSYEFSTTVPGLFTMMARCWSQIELVAGTQTPLTYCDSQLDDFRWGNPPPMD